MNSKLITELDDSFGNASVEAVYPHIQVNAINNAALPLIISLLDSGEVPVYYTQNGDTYELARVAGDPLNLLKLLRVYTFKFVKSIEEIIDVVDNITLMEACK